MKIVIIGGVAGGTSAGAKARRNDDSAEIIIYEKGREVSYSACGLPYYIGGEIEKIEELVPRDSDFFKKKYNIDVLTEKEVLEINPKDKTLTVKDLCTNETFTDNYDKLIISTGATPFIPNIKGIDSDNVFTLRNVQDAIKIKEFIDSKKPKTAVVLGTGFIGFEVYENLSRQNIDVTFIERNKNITPNLDEDMSVYFENILAKKDVKIIKNKTVTDINELEYDLIILATGVVPNVSLAKKCGVELSESRAIKVDETLKTNIDDIYACGDCIETFSSVTGKDVYRPLGSTANKTGRIVGDVVTGGSLKYKGNLSTGIFKFFDLTIANTGLTEKEAIANGFDVLVSHNIKPDKSTYFDGEEMTIKSIADKKSKRLLGVQIIGKDGVDKRIDVFATLITYKATVDELFHIDLAYAPPFSTTKDPVHYTGMILENAIENDREIITSSQIRGVEEEYQIIDTRSNDDFVNKGSVATAVNIPHAKLRNEADKLDKNKPTITFCNKGVTGNACQNILINKGFKKVLNLSGGHTFYKMSKSFNKE